MSPLEASAGAADRNAEIQRAVAACGARRAAGETVTDEQVIADQPQLLPELADALRRLAFVQRAWRRAEGEADADTRPGSTPAGDPLLAQLGDTLPAYRLLREIHRGGQGVVFEAQQLSTNRTVALKIMREGPFIGPADKARFEREVQVLAQLKHPHIVTIHDSGTAAGCYYFVMDYIAGVPLDQWAALACPPAPPRSTAHRAESPSSSGATETSGPPPVRPGSAAPCSGGRAALRRLLLTFADVCDAVDAAHLRGVIHRDLKPSNVRVGDGDHAFVLDFGLAKLTTDGGNDATSVTSSGQFVGSVPWASPEQAAGAPSGLDLRTDVYSLGVMLYQLLTGGFPYDVRGPLRDVLERVIAAQPARPSRASRWVDGELETIVLKCLQKAPERRYQTAGELSRDVRRYLAGEPIDARRDSALYVLRKTLHRYRVAAATATAFVAVIAAALVLSLALWRDSATARDLARQRAAQLRRSLYNANVALAQTRLEDNDVRRARELLEACPADLRAWEWAYLGLNCDRSAATLVGHEGAAMCLALSPDGARLASGGGRRWSAPEGQFDQRVLVWDVATRSVVCVLSGHTHAVYAVAWSPDGARVASTGADGLVFVWDPGSGEPRHVIRPRAGPLQAIAWSPDGARLAAGDSQKQVRLWDAATGVEILRLSAADNPACVAFSSDGELLAAGDWSGTIQIWDAGHGAARASWTTPKPVLGLAFSPDGGRLASASWSQLVQVWAAQTGTELQTLRGHTGVVQSVRFSPDGAQILTGSWDSTARLWETGRGALRATLRGHEGFIHDVAFSPDGRWFASAGNDGTIRLWSCNDAPEPRRIASAAGCANLALSPDARRVAAVCTDACVRVWSLASGKLERRIGPLDATPRWVTFADGGRRLIVKTFDGRARAFALATGELLMSRAEADSDNWRVASTRDGALHALIRRDGDVSVWRADTGQQLLRIAARCPRTAALAFTPDGAGLLFSSGPASELRLWDLASDRARRIYDVAGAEFSNCAEFAADGRRLYIGSSIGELACLDLATGEMRFRVPAHPGGVYAVAISADDQRVATGGWDGRVRLWDAESGEQILTLARRDETINHLAFSCDGRALVAGMDPGGLLIWETRRDQAAPASAGEYAARPRRVPDAGHAAGGKNMAPSKLWHTFALGLLTAGCQSPQPAAAPPAQADAALAAAPAQLFDGLGSHQRKVTTTSPETQRYFNQGLVWAFAFNHDEAIRSFTKAAQLDPQCAMAWWGVALCHGPHINNPAMDASRSKAAWEALQKAIALQGNASPTERALIQALAKRYADPPPADRRPLDEAYAAAMRAVWQANRTDADIGALFAESMMDLRPWDLWTKAGQPQPGTEEIVVVLEESLRLDPNHPGANHLYIHAVEASPHPEKAQASADRLRTLVPAAGHLVHMPSHIDVRVGQWERGAASNEAAMEADRVYRAKSPRQGFYRVYMAHNPHFLCWTAMMEGRGDAAWRAARQVVDNIPPDYAKANAALVDPAMTVPLDVLKRFGRWDQILSEPPPPQYMPISTALWHNMRGIAYAAKGQVAKAKQEQSAFRAAVKKVPADAMMAINPASTILSIADHLLAGEIAFREGRIDEAVAALRAGVKLEDELRYMEPPDWIQPVRHTLGAVLVSAGRFSDAEVVYREDLKYVPENGWSLYGLAECLRKRGATAEAAEVEARFKKAWSRADTKIGSSCLCVARAE